MSKNKIPEHPFSPIAFPEVPEGQAPHSKLPIVLEQFTPS